MKTKYFLMVLMAMAAITASATMPAKQRGTFKLGLEAYQNGNLDMAQRYFETAVEADDNAPLANAYLGSLVFDDDPQKAVEYLNLAIPKLSDRDAEFKAWALNTRAQALLMLKKNAEAKADADKALELNSDAPDYLTTRAFALYRLEDRRAAADDIVKAVAINPDADITLAEHLIQLLAVNELPYTAQLLDYYVQNDPKHASIWQGLLDKANTMVEEERYERELIEGEDASLAEFKGGKSAMNDWLDQQSGWDRMAPPIKVVVECHVDTDGKITEVKTVSKNVDPDLAARANDICLKMPAFTPAYFDGEPIGSRIQITVRFPQQ